jgi:hypothetical protein
MCPLDNAFLGNVAYDRCVLTLDRQQAVDNHNIGRRCPPVRLTLMVALSVAPAARYPCVTRHVRVTQ